MSTFLLVHGAWHGAWCWYRMLPRLEAAGHRVLAVDLPGKGRDRTSTSRITLDVMARRVCDYLDREPEPVTLVGHSQGGLVVSRAAEMRPDRIRRLVYLAAFLLADGESLAQKVSEVEGSLVPPNMILSEDGVESTVRADAIREAFYACCPEEDVALARLLLAPEALLVSSTPMQISDASFGRVPRSYIECSRDRAILVELQRRMYTNMPCEHVYTIDTDHSPFFSRPAELAGHLLEISAN